MVQKPHIAFSFIMVTMTTMQFHAKNSFIADWAKIGLYLFAILAVMVSFSCGWRAFLAALLGVSFLCQKKKREVIFSYLEKNIWLLGDTVMRLEPSSVVLRYLLILHFRSTTGCQRKTIVLFSDQFSLADYRALRLSLSRTAPFFSAKCRG